MLGRRPSRRTASRNSVTAASNRPCCHVRRREFAVILCGPSDPDGSHPETSRRLRLFDRDGRTDGPGIGVRVPGTPRHPRHAKTAVSEAARHCARRAGTAWRAMPGADRGRQLYLERMRPQRLIVCANAAPVRERRREGTITSRASASPSHRRADDREINHRLRKRHDDEHADQRNGPVAIRHRFRPTCTRANDRHRACRGTRTSRPPDTAPLAATDCTSM